MRLAVYDGIREERMGFRTVCRKAGNYHYRSLLLVVIPANPRSDLNRVGDAYARLREDFQVVNLDN
jgi:hypothetical protein